MPGPGTINRSINFYRDTYYDETNKSLIDAAIREDYFYLLTHIFNQDLKHIDEFFDEKFENRFGLQRIFQHIANESEKRTILDVGCGNAGLLKRLMALGHKIMGVDVSPIRTIKNRELIRNYHFGFAENIPLDDNVVDVIIATEVLEHIFNLDKVLGEFNRLLKTNGKLYVQVPLRDFADGTNHLRHFDPERLATAIDAYGFSIHSVELIPYLMGEEPRNIFVIAEKS